jgi:hypothetical protein
VTVENGTVPEQRRCCSGTIHSPGEGVRGLREAFEATRVDIQRTRRYTADASWLTSLRRPGVTRVITAVRASRQRRMRAVFTRTKRTDGRDTGWPPAALSDQPAAAERRVHQKPEKRDRRVVASTRLVTLMRVCANPAWLSD